MCTLIHFAYMHFFIIFVRYMFKRCTFAGASTCFHLYTHLYGLRSWCRSIGLCGLWFACSFLVSCVFHQTAFSNSFPPFGQVGCKLPAVYFRCSTQLSLAPAWVSKCSNWHSVIDKLIPSSYVKHHVCNIQTACGNGYEAAVGQPDCELWKL